MKEPTLYLIDGSSYIFRAYHAIRALTTSKGFPTNAIYGFTNMIFRFLKEYEPEYIGVVFDSKGETFRNKIYPLYKANRDEPPDELKVQFPKIFEVVEFEAREETAALCPRMADYSGPCAAQSLVITGAKHDVGRQ